MRARPIFGVVAIVAAAIVLFAAWPPPDPTSPLSTPGPTPVANARQLQAVDANHAAAAPRTPAADLAASPLAQPFVVQVVDERGAPVPGSVVHHDAGGASEKVRALPAAERRRYWQDRELLLRTFGSESRTDDAGQVALRSDGDSVEVCARDGERFALVAIDRREPPPVGGHRLVLHADTTLRVQCRDHLGGAAASVPLRITRHAPDGKQLEEVELPNGLSTDADGIATLPHAQDVLPIVRDGDTLRVAAQVLGAEGPWATIAPHALPIDPLLLVLPPLGHLALRLLVDDRPPPGRHLLWLSHGDDSRLLWPDAQRGDGDGAPGITTCRWVALQATFDVRLEPSDWQSHTRSWRIEGPREPLATLQVDLPIADQHAFATARLLDPAGRPLPGVRVHVTPTTAGTERPGAKADANGWPRTTWQRSATTDGDGRVGWALLPANGAATVALQLRVQPDDGPALQAVVQVPTSPGRHELGDVSLATIAAVVRGRFVIGEHPAPYFQWFVERPVDDSRWTPVDGLSTQHDASGHFAAYGELPPGRCRIAPSSHTALQFPPVEFRVGDQDVVVPIPNEWLAAAVLLPDDLPWGVLGELVPLQTAMPIEPIAFFTFDVRVASVEPAAGVQHTLRWTRLPRGRYRLELRLFGGQEPLHVVPELTLPRDEAEPLVFDLRGRLGAATVQLTTPLPEASVLFVPDRHATRPFHHPIVDGAVRFPVPTSGAPVLVVAPGKRAQRLLATPGRHVVTLHEATPVRCEFPALAKLPAGVTAHLTLRPLPFEGAPQSRHSSGGLSHLLATQVQYELQDGVATLSEGGGMLDGTATILLANATTAVELPSQPFTPPDGDGPVRIDVPAADLQHALQQLGAGATGR